MKAEWCKMKVFPSQVVRWKVGIVAISITIKCLPRWRSIINLILKRHTKICHKKLKILWCTVQARKKLNSNTWMTVAMWWSVNILLKGFWITWHAVIKKRNPCLYAKNWRKISVTDLVQIVAARVFALKLETCILAALTCRKFQRKALVKALSFSKGLL